MTETPSLDAPVAVESLTPRQREVLALLARGRTNFEIAEALGISLEGAKYHVREILGRLGVETREDAAEWWRHERRPATRLRRGFGWFFPRIGLALSAVLALSFVAVVVAVGVASGGGGKPAPAYVLVCGEGDVALEATSELRPGSQIPNPSEEVRVQVGIRPTGQPCYLGSEMTASPEHFDATTARLFPGSHAFDTVLTGGASVTFTIRNWCADFTGETVIVTIAGSVQRLTLDHAAEDCASLANATCVNPSGQVTPCGAVRSSLAASGGVLTSDWLDFCDPRRLRVGVDTNPPPLPYVGLADHPIALPPGFPVPASLPLTSIGEGTGFALTWSLPERPLDCELKSGARVRLFNAAGTELDVDGLSENSSLLVRFRRTTLPGQEDRDAPLVHLPGSGSRGDYSTETTIVSHAEGTRWLWRNWCGQDRSPVTLEVTTAAGRVTATVERPSCVDPGRGSVVFRVY